MDHGVAKVLCIYLLEHLLETCRLSGKHSSEPTCLNTPESGLHGSLSPPKCSKALPLGSLALPILYPKERGEKVWKCLVQSCCGGMSGLLLTL